MTTKVKYGDHYPVALTPAELEANARAYMADFREGTPRESAYLARATVIMTGYEPWDKRYRTETCYVIPYRQDARQCVALVNVSDALYKALWPSPGASAAAFVRIDGKTYPMLVASARDVRDNPISPYSGLEWPHIFADPTILLMEWDSDVEIGPRKCYYVTVYALPEPE